MIDDAAHPLWRGARRWCLLPGLALGLAGAALWQWGPAMPGVVMTTVAAPIATLGYLGLIAALSRPPGPVMSRALAAGGSSLSVYLGQSIILSTVFAGYGLGLWEAVDRLTAVAIAIATTGSADRGAVGMAQPLRARAFRMGLAADHLRRVEGLIAGLHPPRSRPRSRSAPRSRRRVCGRGKAAAIRATVPVRVLRSSGIERESRGKAVI